MGFIIVVSIVASFTTGTSGTGIDVTDRIENVAADEQPAFPTAPIDQEAPSTEVPAE